MKSLSRDKLLGVIVVLIAAFFALYTNSLGSTNYVGDPGPKMFPFIGCGIMAICGILLIVRPSKGTQGQFLTRDQLLHALLLFGIYVLYLVLLWIVGYTVTIPIILFIISMMFSFVSDEKASMKKRIITNLIYSIVISAVLYLVFVVVLESQLPKGIIWALFKG